MSKNKVTSFGIVIEWHGLDVPFTKCEDFLKSQANEIAAAINRGPLLKKGCRLQTENGLEFMVVHYNSNSESERNPNQSFVYGLKDHYVIGCSYFNVYADFYLGPVDHSVTPATQISVPFTIPSQNVPRLVIWQITKKCTFTCPHCYYFGKGIIHGADLSFEQGCSILDGIAEAGIPAVSFSGGEPMLHPKVMDLTSYAADRNLSVVIDTSGAYFNTSVCEELYKRGARTAIASLDGVDYEHDASRGEGCYQNTIAGIKAAVDAGIFVAVNIVVTKLNEHMIRQTIDESIKAGADLVKLENVIPAGRALEKCSELVPTYDELCITANHLERIQKEYANKVSIALPISTHAILHDAPFLCASGKNLLCISNDGFLAPCPSLTHLYYGNDNYDLKKVSFKHALEQARFRIKELLSGQCVQCDYGDECLSGCLTRSYYLNNDCHTSDPLCIERHAK